MSKMLIKKMNESEFLENENRFEVSNFLQTQAMKEIQLGSGRCQESEYLGFYDQEGELIGQALVLYRRRFRFFTEAVIFHGPLMDYSDLATVLEAIKNLETYFKAKGVAAFSFEPYALNTVKSEELEIVEEERLAELKQVLLQNGFSYELDPSQSTIVNTMFVKPISQFDSTEAIYEAFSNSLKRDLKKFASMQVKVEELDALRLQDFYDILEQTAERKGFGLQDFAYFERIKKAFGNRANFMLAYLDLPAYRAYLDQNIQDFEDKIKGLEEGPQKKRTKGQIADARDQLSSYYKRKDQLASYQIEGDKLPLSSYLFISNDHEMVSFQGGNIEEYMNFGGATLLHWDMIQKAFASGQKAFNFYGTIETETANKGKGNFYFKRQFGGELHILLGQFSKTLNPIYKLINFLKK